AALDGRDHVTDPLARGVVGSEAEQLPRVLRGLLGVSLGRVAEPLDQVRSGASRHPGRPSCGAVAASDPGRLAVFADGALAGLVRAPQLRALLPELPPVRPLATGVQDENRVF